MLEDCMVKVLTLKPSFLLSLLYFSYIYLYFSYKSFSTFTHYMYIYTVILFTRGGGKGREGECMARDVIIMFNMLA